MSHIVRAHGFDTGKEKRELKHFGGSVPFLGRLYIKETTDEGFS